MKHASLLIGIATCSLVASTLVVAEPVRQSTQQQASGAAADDSGARLFGRMCADCHDPSRIVGSRRSKTEWESVINKMIENGATGSEKDFESVYNYLVRNFGKVYINSATPADLAMILGLSDKDAETIVAYRKANGAFADFEAVKKVPDIDVKKVEEHKDAVAF